MLLQVKLSGHSASVVQAATSTQRPWPASSPWHSTMFPGQSRSAAHSAGRQVMLSQMKPLGHCASSPRQRWRQLPDAVSQV